MQVLGETSQSRCQAGGRLSKILPSSLLISVDRTINELRQPAMDQRFFFTCVHNRCFSHGLSGILSTQERGIGYQYSSLSRVLSLFYLPWTFMLRLSDGSQCRSRDIRSVVRLGTDEHYAVWKEIERLEPEIAQVRLRLARTQTPVSILAFFYRSGLSPNLLTRSIGVLAALSVVAPLISAHVALPIHVFILVLAAPA